MLEVPLHKGTGARPIQALVKVYQAKCLPIADNGSDLLDYRDYGEIQRVKNDFARRLLSLPQMVATFTEHEELGMDCIPDKLFLSPMGSWLKVDTELELNQAIIRDCIALEKGLTIPQLYYIKDSLEKLGCAALFGAPEQIRKKEVTLIKRQFMTTAKVEQEEKEL
ncbi:hypothetical protein NDU88_005586 [Pleurodeles waltl]|uniref:Uncharacterized protein n=1 Tax=Pleurodeles waltl TaxID=8319 RepID=A0AAV7WCC7_PLEWA|nr:hypothetical protein NDU88_005586 [Pleurodeles waltl]